MAFDFFADQDKNKQESSSPGQGLGPQDETVTGGQQQGQSGGTSSGSFTNLQSYLDANKDKQFGQQVAGRVSGTIDEANQAQDTAGQGFKSKVDSSTIHGDQGLLDKVKSDPTSVANDDTFYNEFTKERDAQYKGPNRLVDTEDYVPAYQKQEKARETANMTKDEGGRKAYLQQQYGSGVGRYDYNSGQQKLDNLLIQNDAGSKKAFEDVQGTADQSSRSFNDLQGYLDQYAAQGRGTTQATRQGARNAVGIDDSGNVGTSGALPDELKTADSNVAARRAALQQEQQLFGGNAGKKNLSEIDPALLSRMGVDPSQYTGTKFGAHGPIEGMNADQGYLFGVDPSRENHFTPEGDITRSSANSTEELARIQALSKLAGVDNTFAPGEEAGKYATGNFGSFDKGSFDSRYGQARAGFEDEMGQLDKRLQAVFAGNGQVDPTVYQGLVNDIREKYGMPRVGKEKARPAAPLPGGGSSPAPSVGGIRF